MEQKRQQRIQTLTAQIRAVRESVKRAHRLMLEADDPALSETFALQQYGLQKQLDNLNAELEDALLVASFED